MYAEGLQMLAKLSVLYAEDDMEQNEALTKLLKLFFKNVYSAKDGKEALKIIESQNVQIAILDFVMPHCDGAEVASLLKSKYPKSVVILTSAYSDKEKLLKAIDIRAISYLEKPLNEEKLFDALRLAIYRLETMKALRVDFDACSYYDFCERQLVVDELHIPLTKQETLIFELLAHNKGKLVLKETIENAIFGGYIADNSLRNIIYRIRKKLPKELITTSLDFGYKIK